MKNCSPTRLNGAIKTAHLVIPIWEAARPTPVSVARHARRIIRRNLKSSLGSTGEQTRDRTGSSNFRIRPLALAILRCSSNSLSRSFCCRFFIIIHVKSSPDPNCPGDYLNGSFVGCSHESAMAVFQFPYLITAIYDVCAITCHSQTNINNDIWDISRIIRFFPD